VGKKNKIVKSVFKSLSDDEKRLALDGLNIYRDGGNLAISLWDKNGMMKYSKNERFKQWIDDNLRDNDVVISIDDMKRGISTRAVLHCDDELKNCTIIEQERDHVMK